MLLASEVAFVLAAGGALAFGMTLAVGRFGEAAIRSFLLS